MHGNAPSTILVRAPNWVGDQILAYPFFHFLRRAYPRARIVSACVPWVEAIQFRNLIDDVIVLPKSLKPGFMGKWDALQLGIEVVRKAGPWDVGYLLPQSFSSAWLFFRGNVIRRRGFSGDARGFLLTDPVSWDVSENQHRAQAYVNLLPENEIPKLSVRDFWGTPPENDLDPGTPGVFEKFDAARAWPTLERVTAPNQPYWVLAPGSMAETRRWNEASFASLAQKIHDKTGMMGLVIGGPSEAPVARRLHHASGSDLHDWTAQGGIPCYAEIFRNARFTLSNDSGLAHVASLCGSPTWIVWGAGNPKRTRPLGPGLVKIVFNPIDCWPCEKNICMRPEGIKRECLEGITVDSVWKELEPHV